MTTTLERLQAILVKDYQLDPAKLTPDAPLEALGIDSLGVAELLFNVEDEFKITLPAEPVQLATIGAVVDYIDALVSSQGASPQAAAQGIAAQPDAEQSGAAGPSSAVVEPTAPQP